MNKPTTTIRKNSNGRTVGLMLALLVTVQVPTTSLWAQKAPVGNDSSTPLHLLTPDYTTPYGVPSVTDVKATMDRVLAYLAATTPTKLEDRGTNQPVSDVKAINANTQLVRGDFRLASYEWGVTYSAMLKAATTTGDAAYSNYVLERMDFLATIAPAFDALISKGATNVDPQLQQILRPHALDDAGAVCAAMMRTALSKDRKNQYDKLINNYMDFILNKEFRLPNGQFARNRPFKNTVWLDDMYMSLPALVEYSRYKGDSRYADEAAQQILLFKDNMYVAEKGLFRHGWVQDMDPHPAYFWGRANGWAFLTLSDVLDVLPSTHKDRPAILQLFQEQAAALAALQSGSGFWHQLLNKPDSYLESSCTAIFTYCFAHGICEGWLNPKAYGPVALLGWQAVATKISPEGRVEGTCVGTGMGFDPAFYYHRPVSAAAAHGYGPALLAGSEVVRLIKTQHPRSNDSAVQFYAQPQTTKAPIFSEQ